MPDALQFLTLHSRQPDLPAYAGLVYPSLRPELLHAGGEDVFAAAARDGPTPVALALARRSQRRHARLLSIYTAPAYRRQGVATALLRHLFAQFIAAGVRTTHTRLLAHHTAAAGLFQANGWRHRGQLVHGSGQLQDARGTFFLRPVRHLPDGMRAARWGELDNDQQRTVDELRHPNSALLPFYGNRFIDPHCSTVLLTPDEQIRGWLMAMRLPYGTQMASWGVHPDYEGSYMLGVRLLRLVLGRTHESYGATRIYWQYHPSRDKVDELTELLRRFGPVKQHLVTYYSTLVKEDDT